MHARGTMKVGDLVREIVRPKYSRKAMIGIILEVDQSGFAGGAPFLVCFPDGSDWMAYRHLELVSRCK